MRVSCHSSVNYTIVTTGLEMTQFALYDIEGREIAKDSINVQLITYSLHFIKYN